MFIMPKAFPIEFRRDVVAVARKGEAPLSQIAKDFGISESCLHRWLKLADADDGVRPGVTSSESAELRDCGSRTRRWSRRTRSCAGPRRSSPARSPQNDIPAVLDLAADGIPVAVTCRVLGFSKQAFYAWRADPVSRRDWDEAHLINAALDIHADDPAFGYRFIADELPARGIIAAGEQGGPPMLPAADLVGVQQKTRPGPQGRAAGAR
jgi:transposase-like protein